MNISFDAVSPFGDALASTEVGQVGYFLMK